jgi:peptide/nickel transport system permease protein
MAQYFIWIGNMLQGEFGYSYLNHERVGMLLWEAYLPTLYLVIGTTIVGLLIALPSTIIAASQKDTGWDYGFMGLAIVGYSMPSF